jgi:MazG family protein
VKALLQIMARLRDPLDGCPWDREQTFKTIVPYTIEEAYEVASAIASDDMDELRRELGDLLFQVVFYAQIAQEKGLFNFDDVVDDICDKMVRRHPHVFADEQIASAEQQSKAWELMKRQERHEKQSHGVLDDVAQALPALMRAQKLQKRAARVGFDWSDRKGVLAKIHEELNELEQAMEMGAHAAILDECGDVLFSCVNMVRHCGVDAEEALRQANGKFEHRFHLMEEQLRAQGQEMSDMDQTDLDGLWQEAKSR